MDDLISRQAAINAIDNLPRSYRTKEQRARVGGYADVAMVIEELPSAERHGRWIKDKNLYKCTACNDLLSVAGWADCIPKKQIYTAFKYCPNCGAKMDETVQIAETMKGE